MQWGLYRYTGIVQILVGNEREGESKKHAHCRVASLRLLSEKRRHQPEVLHFNGADRSQGLRKFC